MDVDKINKTILDYDIRMSANASDLLDLAPVQTVEEVINGNVCAHICTDLVVSNANNDVGAWQYNDDQTCICHMVKMCYNQSMFKLLDDFLSQFEAKNIPFVLGKQLLPCSINNI